MGTGMRVSAVVALAAAIGVAFALPARRRPEAVALPQPEDAAPRPDTAVAPAPRPDTSVAPAPRPDTSVAAASAGAQPG
jgi:hypothetical protein